MSSPTEPALGLSVIDFAHSSFVLAYNGVASSPPVEPLIEYMNARLVSQLIRIQHPLSASQGSVHEVEQFRTGVRFSHQKFRRFLKAPYSYIVDSVTPIWIAKVDYWIGFGPLSTLVGLVRRRLGLVQFVVHWSIDFSPRRFSSTPFQHVYEWIDRTCCEHADLRVALTAAAAAARSHQHKSARSLAPLHIAPIGVWYEAIEPCHRSEDETFRLAYAGAIDDRNGASLLIEIAEELRQQGLNFHLDVIGGGPLLAQIVTQIESNQLSEFVTVHGFLSEHGQVMALLKNAHLGLAPYAEIADAFTYYGDPSKIKAYFAAGLPVVMTAVSEASRDIADSGGAILVGYSAVEFSAAIRDLSDHESIRRTRANKALEYVRNLDWNRVFDDFVAKLPRGV